MQNAKLVAQIVIDAARIREESYGHVAADAATADESVTMVIGPSYAKFYTKNMRQACHEAAGDNPALAGIVYLALDGWWNDTLDWAKAVLDPTATCAPTIFNCQHGTPYNNEENRCDLCKKLYEKESEE